MPRTKQVDGVRSFFTAAEEAARDAEELEATRPRTQAEIDAEIDSLTDQAMSGTDRDRAFGFLLADVWRSINPGLTQDEARIAVRDRFRQHMATIKS